MADLTQVDELLAAGQGETGQEGMPTPEDIIRFEEERVAAAAGKPAPPAPIAAKKPEDGAGEGEPIDEEVQSIIKKLEENPDLSTLSDDEKAVIIAYKAQLEGTAETPDDDKKTYNIGGRLFTAAEIDAKMKDEWFGDEINPSPERLAKIREGFVKSRNREAGHVATVQQQQVNAAERQALLQAKLLQQQEVDRRKADRERIRKDMEYEKARAAVDIDESKIYNEDGRLDPLALTKYQAKVAATERLSRLGQDEKDTDTRIAEGERTLLMAEVGALIAVAPQYKMSIEPYAAFDRVANGGTIDEADKMKVLDLDQLIRSARSKGISLEDEYALQKQRGILAIKPSAQSAGPSKPTLLPGLPTNAEGLTKMLRDLRKRQAAAPPGAGGTGASRSRDNRSDAHKVIDHDRELLAGGEKDPFLKDLGYGTRV